MIQEVLKQLPKVQRLLETEQARLLSQRFSYQSVLNEIRETLQQVRETLRNGEQPPPHLFTEKLLVEPFFGEVESRLQHRQLRSLRRVINATGIAIHTNLGRVPLPPQAAEALLETALNYTNLEFNLANGQRGSRYVHTDALLCTLTGSEAALVVNNNAAAVLLALSTVVNTGEVLISRGELVEIGGSFRIPDVIAQSGAKLVEVGTTNKTKLSDYEHAISSETRLILKVHPSNYRIIGFVSAVDLKNLVTLGQEHQIPVMQDLGSGALFDLKAFGLPHEPTVEAAIRAGADIITFSGDKLLGGPQAGIVVGKRNYIEKMKKNPLIRALRIDKLSLAALEATLKLYLDREYLPKSLPIWQILTQTEEQLLCKATKLQSELVDLIQLESWIEDSEGFAGGGTLPERGMPTKLVKINPHNLSVEQLSRHLQQNTPPIIGRISEGCFVVDVRTIRDEEISEIGAALRKICV